MTLASSARHYYPGYYKTRAAPRADRRLIHHTSSAIPSKFSFAWCRLRVTTLQRISSAGFDVQEHLPDDVFGPDQILQVERRKHFSAIVVASLGTKLLYYGRHFLFRDSQKCLRLA